MRVRVRARDPARTRPDLVALTLILTLAQALPTALSTAVEEEAQAPMGAAAEHALPVG